MPFHDPYAEPREPEGWRLVAIKRPWIPEWLWDAFKFLALYQPFRWMMTCPPPED